MAEGDGIISRYNEAYYCTVTACTLNGGPYEEDAEETVVLEFIVRGDNSLGPLQEPHHSSLFTRDMWRCPLINSSIENESETEITGRLRFARPKEAFLPLLFMYGAGGYSFVELRELSEDRAGPTSGDEEEEDRETDCMAED